MGGHLDFMGDSLILWASTICFFCAVIHTFLVNQINSFSNQLTSVPAKKIFQFLGEVEIVFGFWAFLFLLILALLRGPNISVEFLDAVDFKEAVFVFVIMCMAATKAVLYTAKKGIHLLAAAVSRVLPVSFGSALYSSIFIVGTLIGSLITEPAAMTVCALLLKDYFFDVSENRYFKYSMLALLFVSISIGGTLTHFAAPPVIMIANAWGWGTPFMARTFGVKATLAIIVCTLASAFFFRKEIAALNIEKEDKKNETVPLWIVVSNLIFLTLCVFYHHYISFLIPLFLLFIGWFEVTKEYQSELKMRESLLVGFFLGGVIALGLLQKWWLEPLLHSLTPNTLFLSATVLTAVTDNAAITFLGSLVPNLSFAAQYALLAGAVAGGGLTVIANAPNPAGYAILNKSFGENGIEPLKLFLWALPYTLVAVLFFLLQ